MLLIGLIFGGVISIAYFDVKALAEQTDYNLNLVYVDEGNYLTGINLPVKNSELVLENISKFSKSDFEAVDLDELDKEDNTFVIMVEKEFYMSILTKDTYTLSDFVQNEDFSELGDYDLSLTKDELLNLIESESATSDLVDILISKNEIPEILQGMAKTTLTTLIDSGLSELGLGLNEVIFAGLLTDAIKDSSNILTLIEGYKEGEVSIYPDRFSFSLIRMLPAGFLASKLESVEAN